MSKERPLRFMACSLLLFTLLSFLLEFSSAATLNRTIDDQAGDSITGLVPLFLPTTGGVWATQTCVGCAILPDTRQTFDGTYTAATYNSGLKNISISMSFEGTAIYVFFVLANNAGDGITSFTTCTFAIDGQSVGSFTHQPDMTTTNIQYNALVFSNTNLENTNHQLVISTSGISSDVYVNFDYAIYTHVDQVTSIIPPTTTTTSSTQSIPSSSTTTSSSSSTTSSSTITSSTASVATSTTTSFRSSSTAGKTSSGTVGSLPTTGNTSGNTSGDSSTTSSGDTSGNSSASSSSHKSSSLGAIVGGVVGGLALVALVILLIMFCRRRKQRALGKDGEHIPSMHERDGGRFLSDPFATANIVHPFIPQTTSPSRSNLLGHNPQPSYSAQSKGGRSVTNSDDTYGGYQSRTNANLSEASGTQGAGAGSASSGAVLAALSSSLSPLTQEEVRRTRQNEIDERLRLAREEINNLDIKSRRSMRMQPRRGAPTSGEQELEIDNMREQMRQMREQIIYLQEQQRSPWAEGLSDEPPPGYTR